ncbi:MAG: hypothetical protein CMJ48_01445 [Planctomycetaceae bacterium]|nr:hypothetical protein [Planctomycetaceae bacterium]
MPGVTLTIDGRTARVPEGTSILDAARRVGVKLPTMCHVNGCKPRAVCRMCVVALGGSLRLVPSCATTVTEGMQVQTDTPEVETARKLLMEFMLAEHGECDDPNCAIERLARQLGVYSTRFQMDKSLQEDDFSSKFITVDPENCILCDRCVQACGKDQQVIVRAGRGRSVAISFDTGLSMRDAACTDCGDCLSVCPAGALAEAGSDV